MSFEHMKSMINYRGETIRQSKIDDTKAMIKADFCNDPSYRDSFVVWEFGKELKGLVKLPIRTFDEKYAGSSGFVLKFNVMIDDFLPVGTVLWDIGKDIYYLCTESYNRDEILCSGKLARCNNRLRWQDDNKNVFDYPILDVNATQYNSGTKDGKVAILGSTQHMITITADDNTIALDHDKRFFLDRNKNNPTVFKLTRNDTTTMWYDKGLLHITVTENEYNPAVDSIDNWLCDYTAVPSPALSVKIIHTGRAEVRTGGIDKTFSVESGDDTVVQRVFWSVELSDEQKDYIVLSTFENRCRIKCLSNEKLVGTKFKLKCARGMGVGELEITVVGGV